MAEFILHNYFRSSTSYRARIALHHKKIPFEYRAVHLLKGDQHSAEYRKMNPIGGIPTLIHNDKIIPDSFAIVEYLEDIQPTPALLPKDPYLKARVRQICEIINSSLHPYGNLKVIKYLDQNLQLAAEKKQAWLEHWAQEGLAALEKNLQGFAGTCCFGDEVTLADAFLIPQITTSQRFNIDMSPYPLLMKIFDHCQQQEAFYKAHPFRQVDTPDDLRIKD